MDRPNIKRRLIKLVLVVLTAVAAIGMPVPASAHGDDVILECKVAGVGGDRADLRGIRFTVDREFVAVEVRMDGRVSGTYTFTAELRRSTGFTAAVDASSPVSVNLPGTLVPPYAVVHIDFPNIAVSGAETFTLKFSRVSGPGNLFFEMAGIGSFPCPNVEETNENNVAVPTVRSDPTGFRVLASNQAPSVSGVSPISSSVSLLVGDSQTFTAEATDPEGNLERMEWHVTSEDASVVGLSGWNVPISGPSWEDSRSWTFPNPGTFTVEAQAFDTHGASGAVAWTVTVAKASARLEPSTVQAVPNQEIEVQLIVNPSNYGVSSGNVHLAFPAGTLELITIEPGPLLGASPIIGIQQIDANAGTIHMALARQGTTPVPTNAGALIIMHFKVSSGALAGDYTIAISTLDLSDADFLDMEVLLSPTALIEVGCALVGDLNGDCTVNHLDLAIMGAAYGTQRGDPDFDPRADLNGDGIIDYKDLAILGANYG